MPLSLKTKIALCIAILFWGSAFVGIRAGLQEYSPGGLAFLRFFVASICLFFIYISRPHRQRPLRLDFWLTVLAGALGIGLYNITLNYGEVAIPAGHTSFIISQSPIITTLFAVFFLRERISFYSILGMAVSVLGILFIATADTEHVRHYGPLINIIIATVMGSFFSIMQKPLLKKYHAIDITTYAIWAGTFVLSMYIPQFVHDIHHASLKSTLVIVYLGIFPAAIAYLAWAYALMEMPASRASTFMYFLPVLASIMGWMLLGEVPGWMASIGGIIALLGVWIVHCSYQTMTSAQRLQTAPDLSEKA